MWVGRIEQCSGLMCSQEVEIHACGSAATLSLISTWALLALATLRHLGLACLAS